MHIKIMVWLKTSLEDKIMSKAVQSGFTRRRYFESAFFLLMK